MLPLPMGLIAGHAGVAVIGFVLLLAATWTATRASRQTDNHHIASCENGNRSRVYMNAEGRIVAQKQ